MSCWGIRYNKYNFARSMYKTHNILLAIQSTKSIIDGILLGAKFAFVGVISLLGPVILLD
jgi:hypothetical protein